MNVYIKVEGKLGVEVWNVYFGDTLVHTFLSRGAAEFGAKRLIQKFQAYTK